jgi:hypothetical protein
MQLLMEVMMRDKKEEPPKLANPNDVVISTEPGAERRVSGETRFSTETLSHPDPTTTIQPEPPSQSSKPTPHRRMRVISS